MKNIFIKYKILKYLQYNINQSKIAYFRRIIFWKIILNLF